MHQTLDHEAMARKYFAACNAADRDAIAGCFTPQAVQYFPAGAAVVGSDAIADRLMGAVEKLGCVWTVDSIMVDTARSAAVVEWSNFRRANGSHIRGDEWIVFAPGTGLISEIRHYFAVAATDPAQTNELGGFDYESRGYPLTAPAGLEQA